MKNSGLAPLRSSAHGGKIPASDFLNGILGMDTKDHPVVGGALFLTTL
jgi:hypothetical protein